VLNPFAERERGSETDLGARAIYSVTEDVEFTVEAAQKGDNPRLVAKLSIDF